MPGSFETVLPDAPHRPVRLPPKARSQRIQAGGKEPVAEWLKMAEEDARRAAAAEREMATPQDDGDLPVRVEAVILGNLPGFGGPWLVQYAHLLAAERGPVAVLHVDESGIDLELVGGPSHKPSATGTASLVDLLRDLAGREQQAVRTFLVHLSSVSNPNELRRAIDLSRWTVCCGADDAAVVSAYRLIKQLVEQDPGEQVSHRSRAYRVGMVVMGSDENRAHAATKKLNTTTGSFLRMPVELIGWRKRMEPVDLQVVGSFAHAPADAAGNGDLWSRLCRLFDELADQPMDEQQDEAMDEAGDAFMPEVDEVMDWDETVQSTQVAIEDDAGGEFGEPGGQPEAQPSETVAGSAAMDPASVASQPPKLAPLQSETASATGTRGRAAPDASAKRTATKLGHFFEEEPDLGAMLGQSIQGAIALDARCPQHPQTQIMLDQDGRLHLLRRHARDRKADSSRTLEALRASLVDLMHARRWVNEHMQLIMLTQRQCRFDPDLEPAMHLFTDDAKCAVELISRLGDLLKLHLLQPVYVGDEGTWFCTELN